MAETSCPNAGVPGSIPGQGTRLHAATKTSHNLIDIVFKNYIKYIVIFIVLNNLPMLTHMLPMSDDY